MEYRSEAAEPTIAATRKSLWGSYESEGTLIFDLSLSSFISFQSSIFDLLREVPFESTGIHTLYLSSFI